MEFTKEIAHEYMQNTIKLVESENPGVKNKTTLNLIMKGFLSIFLLVDNRHVNLLNAIKYVQQNRLCARDMLFNLM